MGIKTFTCNKCGKQITYDEDWKAKNDFNSIVEANQCWTIDLGWAGYGSQLDTCRIKFNLCDNCLKELVDSLHNKQEIEDSSDTYWDMIGKAINKQNIMKGE